MEFAQALRILWIRRAWVLLGAGVALVVGLSTGYHVGLLPPKLTPKALAVGSGQTQLLVDTRNSSLTDSSQNVELLVSRAVVYAQLMTSEPVRQAIAAQVGIPVALIQTEAPLNPSLGVVAREPLGPQRSAQLLSEARGYRLSFQPNLGEPTITITGQAPNATDAARLADGAAVAFVNYISGIEDRQQLPPEKRIVVRQLGAAEGGMIGGGVDSRLVVLAFLGVLLAWMLLVVFVSGVIDSLAESRALGQTPDDAHEQPTAS